MEFKQLSESNIAQVKNEQKWLTEKLTVALKKEQRSEIPSLYSKYHETEIFIECLRREFYRQLVCIAPIPADLPEKERCKIKDSMWQEWRNRRFKTWQQMIDEALKDCSQKEIVKKRKLVEQLLKAAERKAVDIAKKPEADNQAMSAKPLTVTETMLFKIALNCPALDHKIRKPPNHWQVFLAAWKDGQSAYDMERRHKWPRRTADGRLRTVERKFLGGAKVSELIFDPAILRNVEAQLKSAHDHNAKKMWRRDLLDNTTGTENENEDEDKEN